MSDPRDRLIVGLDTPDCDSARRIVERIGDAARFYKIGLGLFYIGGIELARELVADGRRLFLDAKAYDIDQTVENAARGAATLGARLLTVHGDRRIMEAARRGRGEAATRLLAITVLTSMDEASIRELGWRGTVEELVLARAGHAKEAGMDGVVASGQEAAMLREALGPDMLIVTPGIRLPGSSADDQKRVATPRAAIAAGADYLVVAREILRAPDPRAAALRFQEEIAAA
ncbi:MAG: orotidine-5'-phosphate decarboxylase [Alphaproteobacteria bacterium]|nr:orotidine-5'-phosphate decarboxylase [Alphaproteobacteria bacterium]